MFVSPKSIGAAQAGQGRLSCRFQSTHKIEQTKPVYAYQGNILLLVATGLVKNKGFIMRSKITENPSPKTTNLTEPHGLWRRRSWTVGEGLAALEAEAPMSAAAAFQEEWRKEMHFGGGAVQSARPVVAAADSQSYRCPSERRATGQLRLQRAKCGSPEKAPPNATLLSEGLAGRCRPRFLPDSPRPGRALPPRPQGP